MIFDHLKYLGLPIHHVFVLKDLLYSHNGTGGQLLRLKTDKNWLKTGLFFAEKVRVEVVE